MLSSQSSPLLATNLNATATVTCVISSNERPKVFFSDLEAHVLPIGAEPAKARQDCLADRGQRRNPTIVTIYEIASALGVSHIDLVTPD